MKYRDETLIIIGVALLFQIAAFFTHMNYTNYRLTRLEETRDEINKKVPVIEYWLQELKEVEDGR